MNTIELKNKIVQKIDSLNDEEFERVYQQLQEILQSAAPYQLSEEENEAIDSALKASEDGGTYSHDDIRSEAKKKYPNLKFK
ncbi:hypothetical protein [Sunxiuqinia dokdonensis]|uniref:Uncharacterized protein n=1 Tax=Sunxiuqinia dokdonensis TaxID=1409788 RepID=A0A0L8V6G3_9BACT|nr:hypothetical protein [Sunxiuqinia dokdonensis]KOH43948.1 hypothetical protein NC99_32390 [Sunxiuqinia dokdonensis]